MSQAPEATSPDSYAADGLIAWRRLAVSLVLATIGGIGLWAHVIVLPVIQQEFGVDRAGASLPYALTMVAFAAGGMLMGKVLDRFGVVLLISVSAVFLGAGFLLASIATDYWWFVAIQAILIGMLGSSSVFGPLVADISHWFIRRRGIAVALVASGNYLAGAIWPPILNWIIEQDGWRTGYQVVGVVCIVTMIPLAFLLKRPAPPEAAVPANGVHANLQSGLSSNRLFAVLALAGIACCVAMAMPQVHIVAYCGDLGFGAARGAEMLSLMLGLGVVSRVASGVIADRIGGLRTLILGSVLQGITLFLYLPFDSLFSLYVISGLFGLAQGGIVPCYALIVRQYFPASEAGTRVSVVLMMTVLGMALGGWLSGQIFDWTGSYRAAFIHGMGWNLLNLVIAVWLLKGRGMRPPDRVLQAAA